MNEFRKFGWLSLLAAAAMFGTVGCHSNQGDTAAGSGQNGPQDSSSDPAAANLAPVAAESGGQAPAQSYEQQSAPAPAAYNSQQAPPSPSSNYQPSDQAPEYSDNGEQPAYSTDDPPPPLPEYDQPQAPGDDYLWTPGYWAYTQAGYSQPGYYWVPGVWVQAPYEGALWTPGYWGYWHHHYRFYRGY